MSAISYLQLRNEIKGLIIQSSENLVGELFEHEVAFATETGTTRFSSDFVDEMPRVTGLHEIGLDVPFQVGADFGELTWEGADDTRRDMPTGQTARMHRFRYRLWRSIEEATTDAARCARFGLEVAAVEILDLIQFNYRLNQQNGIRSEVIDKIEPGMVGEVYATEDDGGGHYYITEVNFSVQERVSYRLDRTSSL